MKYIVLDRFKARTKDGEVDLDPGQVITLPDDKALKLITEGKVSPAERVAFRVFSEILQAHLWVVYGTADLQALRRQGIIEQAYTAGEISALRKQPGANLKTIHAVKETFPLSTVTKRNIAEALTPATTNNPIKGSGGSDPETRSLLT